MFGVIFMVYDSNENWISDERILIPVIPRKGESVTLFDRTGTVRDVQHHFTRMPNIETGEPEVTQTITLRVRLD